MKNIIGVLVAAIGISFAIITGTVGAALAEPQGGAYTPSGDTVIEITGDKVHGFSIHHYDGSAEFPPTDSEARAECSEYDTEVARVRCRTEVRVWYRDLGRMKRAINFAQSSAATP